MNSSHAAKGGFDFNKPSIVALCYLVGVLTGVLTFLGLILAYLWKHAGEEAWMHSHFRFHIRSFWYVVVASILATPLWIIGLRWIALGLVAAYAVARAFVALRRAQHHQPMPEPETLLW